MKDEVTKTLAKTGDLRLQVKIEDGRMRVITSSAEHNITLKTDQKLEITLEDGSAVLRIRPQAETTTEPTIALDELTGM